MLDIHGAASQRDTGGARAARIRRPRVRVPLKRVRSSEQVRVEPPGDTEPSWCGCAAAAEECSLYASNGRRPFQGRSSAVSSATLTGRSGCSHGSPPERSASCRENRFQSDLTIYRGGDARSRISSPPSSARPSIEVSSGTATGRHGHLRHRGLSTKPGAATARSAMSVRPNSNAAGVPASLRAMLYDQENRFR
jgi:hypothetical protein